MCSVQPDIYPSFFHIYPQVNAVPDIVESTCYTLIKMSCLKMYTLCILRMHQLLLPKGSSASWPLQLGSGALLDTGLNFDFHLQGCLPDVALRLGFSRLKFSLLSVSEVPHVLVLSDLSGDDLTVIPRAQHVLYQTTAEWLPGPAVTT